MPRGGVWKLEAGSSTRGASSQLLSAGKPALMLGAAPVAGLSRTPGVGVSVSAGLSTILQIGNR
jgi:hypothetical protein